jgi:N-acetylhexosamine 1-kinase
MFDAGAAFEAAEAFRPGRTPTRIDPLGNGHIHATFLVGYPDSGRDLVLQRLNVDVFPDLGGVMRNLVRVTEHLRGRSAGAVLEVVPGREGEFLARDREGGVWRAFRYLTGTYTLDVAPNDDVARTAACAFGQFAAALDDLDPTSLAVPIAHFHDLPARLEQMEVAARADRCGRLAAVREEFDATRRLGEVIAGALEAGGVGQLPRRAVHNDCKLNNLLFDHDTGQPVCVVDLDTVMPGTLLVDFGELVRTSGCDAAEDERDLSRVVVSERRIAALAQGYLAGVKEASTSEELALLWAGPPWMAIENAARFMADHLAGDRYFVSGDNRARARTQRYLAARLWDARGVLRESLAAAAGRAF